MLGKIDLAEKNTSFFGTIDFSRFNLGWFSLKHVCLAILLFNLCVFSWRAWNRVYHSDLDTLAISIQDDSYYYLLPAFNLKSHGFFTFDGEHKTYGFQPLYALLLSVQALFFGNRFDFLKSAIFGGYLMYGATALMIFLVVYRLLKDAGEKSRCLGALLGAHVFLLNLTVMYSFTTVKENALYALLLSVAFFLSIWPIMDTHSRPRKMLLSLAAGLLVGLLVLTRLTPASLLISGVLALAWIIRRRPAPVLFLSACALPLLCWGIYAQIEFGSMMPLSGKVKTIGLLESISLPRLWKDMPGMLGICRIYITRIFLYSMGRGDLTLEQYLIEPRPPETMLIRACVFLILLSLPLHLSRRHMLRSSSDARLLLLLVAAAYMGAALTPVIFFTNQALLCMLQYFNWYFADIALLTAILLPTLLVLKARTRDKAASQPGRMSKCLFTAAISAFFVGSGIQTFLNIRPWLSYKYDESNMPHAIMTAVRSLNDSGEFNENVRVGSFNCGLLGYFSKAKIINLDGLANNDMYYSVFKKRLRLFESQEVMKAILDYANQEKIEYLCDVMPPIGFFGNLFTNIEVIRMFPWTVPGWPFQGYYFSRITADPFPVFRLSSYDSMKAIPLKEFEYDGKRQWRQRTIIFNVDAKSIGVAAFALDRQYKSLRVTSFVQESDGIAWNMVVKNNDKIVSKHPVSAAPEEFSIPVSDLRDVSITFENHASVASGLGLHGTPILTDIAFVEGRSKKISSLDMSGQRVRYEAWPEGEESNILESRRAAGSDGGAS